MELQNLIIWQAKPVFEKLFAGSTNGKLRYSAKKNLRLIEPLFGDIIEFINGDKEEHEWEPGANGFPEADDSFYERFEKFLLAETVEYDPFFFSEDLMQYADGITGQEEMIIGFVFTENQPKEEE